MGIRATIGELNALLQQHDHELWSHLEHSKVCCFCIAACQHLLITACKWYSSITVCFIHSPRAGHTQGVLLSNLLHIPTQHHHGLRQIHSVSGWHKLVCIVLYPQCPVVA